MPATSNFSASLSVILDQSDLNMKVSPHQRCLGKAAAILGCLQGLAWAAMSLTAIIFYNWSPTKDSPATYEELLESLLYGQFIQETSAPLLGINFVIRPLDFTVFMWIYFILSFAWTALSIDLYSALTNNKRRQITLMLMWGIITLIASVIDFIFAALLARDYAECGKLDFSLQHLQQLYCYLTIGIGMTLAARGFALWVVNLVMSLLLMVAAVSVIKEGNNYGSLYNSPPIPRVQLPPKTNSTNSYLGDGKTSPNFASEMAAHPQFLNRNSDHFAY